MILAVVTPLTAVLDREPPVIVAVLIVPDVEIVLIPERAPVLMIRPLMVFPVVGPVIAPAEESAPVPVVEILPVVEIEILLAKSPPAIVPSKIIPLVTLPDPIVVAPVLSIVTSPDICTPVATPDPFPTKIFAEVRLVSSLALSAFERSFWSVRVPVIAPQATPDELVIQDKVDPSVERTLPFCPDWLGRTFVGERAVIQEGSE